MSTPQEGRELSLDETLAFLDKIDKQSKLKMKFQEELAKLTPEQRQRLRARLAKELDDNEHYQLYVFINKAKARENFSELSDEEFEALYKRFTSM